MFKIRIDDAPIEITISLFTPYVAYLAAERLQCSGVLATLACGLYLGRRSSGFYSLHARIEASAVWHTLDFVLNGIVFLMLGLQLPYILGDIQGISTRNVIVDGALFSLAVIALRFLWVYPGEAIMACIGDWRGKKVRRVSNAEVFLIGWAGMAEVLARRRHIAQELRNVERSIALDLRNRNKIHDEVLRRLEHELDLLDARFAESD